MKHLWKQAAIAALLVGSGLDAKVSEQEAARLGKDLTPTGATRAGNKEGTIPEWTGGITSAPAGYKVGGRHIDPFAADQPLFTITAENLDQYAAKLTEGQIAMFKKYPSTWKMPVYPTRRSASIPQFAYDAIRRNATSAELTGDGQGVRNAGVASPFPIPQNAYEVVWNHKARFLPEFAEQFSTTIVPTPAGNYTANRSWLKNIRPYARVGDTPQDENGFLAYLFMKTLAPAFQAGEVLLVHEAVDQDAKPRQAWVYNPGTRRVRRAPNIAFDNPGTGTDGQTTADQFDGFNGSMARYNWKLEGVKEIYVPYNSYKVRVEGASLADLIQPGHVKTDNLRYELHRVWHVTATLKEGASHIYARRDLYLDEDSWSILLSDHYDNHGSIWRVSETHTVNDYEMPVVYESLKTTYDLNNGRYVCSGVDKGDRVENWDVTFAISDFSPQALQSSGIR